MLSAVLFGAATPLAKLLLGGVGPWLLAGLLYCGSGIGLGALRLVRRSPRVRLARGEWLPLAGAILFVGIVGPVLLMLGLANMPASGASLLLNAEGVFTATLAWLVFRENVDRRIMAGMAAIVAGAVVLSVPMGAGLGSLWPSLAIVGACLALAFATGAAWPTAGTVAGALVVGFFSYGLSLSLFIVGMRQVGTARAGAYFSVAPFFGALMAVALGEPLTWPLVVAGALMALGVWLHLTERHDHPHRHEQLTHDHWHVHDDHHHHEHAVPVPAGTGHRSTRTKPSPTPTSTIPIPTTVTTRSRDGALARPRTRRRAWVRPVRREAAPVCAAPRRPDNPFEGRSTLLR